MKRIYIILLLMALTILSGCGKKDIPADEFSLPENEAVQENTETPVVPELPSDNPDIPVMPENDTQAPEITEESDVAGAETEISGEPQDVTPAPEPEKAAESVTVSHLAEEDFLTPFDNYSWEREYAPEYVVLHFTSAVMVVRDDPYNMDAMRKIFAEGGVSPHYIVDRDGGILCFIPEDRAAWHAGKGSYGGDERLTDSMNKYSIGIEIAAMGSYNDMSIYMSEQEYNEIPRELIGFTDSQYESLKLLVGDICERYSIPFDSTHVIGHDMYSDRKTDPGELFDWERLFS